MTFKYNIGKLELGNSNIYWSLKKSRAQIIPKLISIETVFWPLWTIIVSIRQRFEQSEQPTAVFSFLYNIPVLKNVKGEKLKKYWMDLHVL